jgi:hypothetical protein
MQTTGLNASTVTLAIHFARGDARRNMQAIFALAETRHSLGL